MTKTLKSLALALIPITLGVTIGCCVHYKESATINFNPTSKADTNRDIRVWSTNEWHNPLTVATNGPNGELVITNFHWPSNKWKDTNFVIYFREHDYLAALFVAYRSVTNGKSIITARDPDKKLWLDVKWTGGTTDDVWKDFYPTNVEIICSHEPIITNKNGEWIIRFKP